MAGSSRTEVERLEIALDTQTAFKLAALEQACAQQTVDHGESAAGRREIATTALVRGIHELYEVHVRGTAFDLRQQHATRRQQARRRGLRVV